MKGLSPDSYTLPVVAAVVLHGLLVLVFVVKWHAEPVKPMLSTPPPVVKAVIVEKPKSKPVVKKTRPAVKKKSVKKSPPKKVVKKEVKKTVSKKVVSKSQKKPQKLPQRAKPTFDQSDWENQLDADEDLLKKRQEEEALREAKEKENEARQMTVADKYKALIVQTVSRHWSRPLSARDGMKTTVRISMIPGGEIVDVRIVESSGDAAYDLSVVQALHSAEELPVPSDQVPEEKGVFDRYFRTLTLVFNPEDLNL